MVSNVEQMAKVRTCKNQWFYRDQAILRVYLTVIP